MMQLPESLSRRIEQLASTHGFDSPTEFLEDFFRQFEPVQKPFAANIAAVEAELRKGLESGPAKPMTADDWERLRNHVREVAARRLRA